MRSLAALDPRFKLLFLLLLSGTAMLLSDPVKLLGLLALTLLVLLAAGVSPGRAWGQLRGMLGLLLLLFILQALFNRSGEPLIVAGGITLLTTEGLRVSAMVTLRLLVIVCSALLVLTGELRDYLLAMTQCRLPYELAFMILAALRFIPMLRAEAADILCAVQMRGCDIKGARLPRKIRIYSGLLLPIVAGAIRRSEEMSLAMEARCFRALPARTYLRRLKFRRWDFVWLGGFLVLLAGVWVL